MTFKGGFSFAREKFPSSSNTKLNGSDIIAKAHTIPSLAPILYTGKKFARIEDHANPWTSVDGLSDRGWSCYDSVGTTQELWRLREFGVDKITRDFKTLIFLRHKLNAAKQRRQTAWKRLNLEFPASWTKITNPTRPFLAHARWTSKLNRASRNFVFLCCIFAQIP